MTCHQSDVLIIGCGVAGCVAALELAQRGLSVTLLSSATEAKESNSYYAQGGIVYLGQTDSAESLYADIIQAGSGLCWPDAVRQLVELGPACIEELLIRQAQVPFDRRDDGSLSFTHEGAHAQARILHARDQTGKAMIEALLQCISVHPHIQLLTSHSAIDLITLAHHSKRLVDIYEKPTCVGAYALDHQSSEVKVLLARETILATGGLGEVFLHTTNPPGARGDGVAMAFRAGARIMNMEYVQFHPTSLFTPNERRFLLSEALRGEGAQLLDIHGQPFMHHYHEMGSLAPRDVVARCIYSEMVRTSSDHVWLDMSFKESAWIQHRFPAIYHHCLQRGIDMAKNPVPVVPAAHYACGGIAVDKAGQTTIHRLRAIGEVSCTGVHGANRLASTSLLEGVVWAKTAAESIQKRLQSQQDYFPPVSEWVMSDEVVDQALIQQDWTSIKQTMWNYVGLVRDEQRLQRSLKMLQGLKWEIESFYARVRLNKEVLGLRNGIQTALLIAQGAVRNRSSLGCHYRL
jgi:L-aspartate oxidase